MAVRVEELTSHVFLSVVALLHAGLLENAIYGGRVDDTFDLRVLQTYLREFFSTAVLSGQKVCFCPFALPLLSLSLSLPFSP